MNPEQEYEKTKELTKDILEFYKQYLTNQLKNTEYSSYMLQYKETSKYFDYDAVYYLDTQPIWHVEVKVRTDLELRTYPDSKIPLRKHGVALYHYQAKKIKSHYLALYSDGLYRCILHEFPDSVKIMPNRKDRGDELNEYAMYNHDRFELIG